MIRFVLAAILLLPRLVLGQLNDSFSDGNFSADPHWSGDSSGFIINSNFQLQSQGPTTSTSIYLSTASSMLSNTIWEFWVQLAFSPSTTNYAKIYLSSDNPDLKGSLRGYYIKVGGITGNGDAIDLYRQNGSTSTKIIGGIPGHAGKSTNKLRIKIQRDLIGNWLLLSDTLGGTNFLPEGKAFDSTYKQSNYVGVVCQYSSTRSNQFYFDDFIIEQAPLSAESVTAINDSIIELKFNNELEASSALDMNHYLLSSIGFPKTAELSSESSVLLTFFSKIPNASYTIEIKNLKAQEGKSISSQSLSFYFKAPLIYGSLLISEIYADPSHSNGLPEEEFIELYNNSSDSINLNGFKFSDPHTIGVLQNFILAPNEYIILTSAKGFDQYQSMGKAISVTPWPSLNNDGDDLMLKDETGNLLFSVSYSSKWYQESAKSKGGWSLEMINPLEICKGSSNWKSSIAPIGGTPGKVNSVYSSTFDLMGPKPILSTLEDSSTVLVSFDKGLNSEHLMNSFKVETNPILSTLDLLDEKTIRLHWLQSFLPSQEFIIKYHDIKDCLNNSSSGEIHIIYPGKADSLDVIINEILFHPKPGGIDFVEIYNLSGDIIDLKKLSIVSIKKNGQILSVPIASDSNYIYPQSYKVICSSREILQSLYPLAPQESIIEIHNFPSYNNDQGIVAISSEGKYIDYFAYYESYHSGLLKDKQGVSLERISFVAPSNYSDNWQSASGLVGFATPGYQNSMHHENTSEKAIDIQPKVITPNGDLDKDQAYINFRFDKVGNYCSIKIFNTYGTLVRNLADNMLTGENGFFIWDGSDDGGRIVETGIYILFLEYFNESGSKGKSKQTIVVYSDK